MQLCPRRWPRVLFASAGLLVLIVLLLSYNDSIKLWLRFHYVRLGIHLRPMTADNAWKHQAPEFTVDAYEDVGLIIKTGYGTRHRIPATLGALEKGFASRDVIVVADFSSETNMNYTYNGQDIRIHDVLATSGIGSLRWSKSIPRLKSYLEMANAIVKNDTAVALEIGQRVGWELDAMKFIPGLQLAFSLMPQKKWYILMDDDSYLVKPSIIWLLQRLNPNLPHYIGDPVGDFKGRFGYGGSSVMLSRPVLHELFIQNPDIVSEAYSRSRTETLGDRLLATTLMKIGVYVDERYERLFTGRTPLDTRIWWNRFCLPILSFHHLVNPRDMQELGDLFKSVDGPVHGNDVWKIYRGPDIGSFSDQPIRIDEDHVGGTDSSSETFQHIKNPNDCLEACQKHQKCIAWTWDSTTWTCNISPWMVVGQRSHGKFSGIHAQRVRNYSARCSV